MILFGSGGVGNDVFVFRLVFGHKSMGKDG